MRARRSASVVAQLARGPGSKFLLHSTPNQNLKYVGIDGCRGGWIVASGTQSSISLTLFSKLADLHNHLSDDATVMIDMPIGLLEAEGVRECDRLARVALGRGQSSSVFSPPIRQVSRLSDYAEANQLSLRLSGKGLSKQAFNITPKIWELDRLLESEQRRGYWQECHPEVVFSSLSTTDEPIPKKKTPEGQARRLALLSALPRARHALDAALTAYPRKSVLADDIIDALACFYTATLPMASRTYLPERAEHDNSGLAMQLCAPKRG